MCDLDVIGVPSKLSVIRRTSTLERMFPTRALSREKQLFIINRENERYRQNL